MCMKLGLLLSLIPAMAMAMDRMSALSMVETGNDDRMVGAAGEISRFQVLKAEWRTVTSSTDYANPRLAKEVAQRLLDQRVQRFQTIYKRCPSDFEFYGLWNAPSQVLGARVSRTVAERCRCFANLCNWKN